MALQGYLLPQNRYIDQPVAAPVANQVAQPALALPALTDNYANVQGVTDEFINTVGQLKSYAHDMAKTYGIDVTKPDYSQPGGGQPYRTFQELSAKSIMTGNDLKARMVQNQLMDKGVIEGKWRNVENPDEVPLGADISQRGYNIGLDPDVDAVVKRTQTGNFYTERDAQNYNTQVVMKKRDEWQKKADNAKSETEKKYAELQVAALTDAVKETYPGLLIPRGGDGKKSSGAILIKEITNLAQGRWKPGDYTKIRDKNGDVIFVNKARNGQPYGDFPYTTGTGPNRQEKKVKRIIDRWVKRPDGSVWLEFRQTEKGQDIPAERVDDTNSGSVASVFFSNVASYGKALEDAQSEGWVDDAGFVDYDKVPSEGYTTPDTESERVKTEAAKNIVRVGLKTATKSKPLVLKVGEKKIEIKPNWRGGGHYIEVDGEELDENLSEEEIFEYLQKEGYFDQALNSEASDRLPNETEGAYQLRLLRAKQAKK